MANNTAPATSAEAITNQTAASGISRKLDAFIGTPLPDISLSGFVINLLLAALLAYILGLVYVRYGRALSNRRLFAQNFVLLASTTMIVISVVKSSLALSLGLVGALSIVRFRAAIKEPEELSFLFICIAIGLGFGGDQRLPTLIGFVILMVIVIVRGLNRDREQGHNLYVTVTSAAPASISADRILKAIEPHCRSVNLKRLDESNEIIETLFAIEIDSFDALNKARADLRALDESVSLTFMDNDRQVQ
ncbi:MAG: DUF4956 domain-containing protein [Rhodospirillaceae bacterium]|jgi:hypothetical protein|nr:DUF4956 domain-containing protein [Rhodospirillaceae bacterium]MBT5455348.1 DUF4956 domain-containing protein [Rhodospirillaceae bacterium]